MASRTHLRTLGPPLVLAQLLLRTWAVAVGIPGGPEATLFAGGKHADRGPGGGIFSPDRATGEKLFPCGDGCAGSFTYDVPRPVKVVLWTESVIVYKRYVEYHAPNCSVVKAFKGQPASAPNDGAEKDAIVLDPDYDLSDADVVVFNVGILERSYVMPRKKREGQLWIAGCWEPEDFDGRDDFSGDCSLLHDEKTMALMDGVASYNGDAAVPAFFTPPTEEQMRRPAPEWGGDRHVRLASSAFSDCRSEARNDWVRALNASLVERGRSQAVTSYGRCLNNHVERECDGKDKAVRPSKPGDLQDVWLKSANRCMARPFALVAENSQTPWYVTEKIWNALATGAVPVYWGPPEAKYLVPPGCCIFASDYASTEELVDTMLSFDDEKHAAARAWKDAPVQDWGNWTRVRRLSRATVVPRLCEAAAARPALTDIGNGAAAGAEPHVHPNGKDAGGGRAKTHSTPSRWSRRVAEMSAAEGKENLETEKLLKKVVQETARMAEMSAAEGSGGVATGKAVEQKEVASSAPVVPDFKRTAAENTTLGGSHGTYEAAKKHHRPQVEKIAAQRFEDMESSGRSPAAQVGTMGGSAKLLNAPKKLHDVRVKEAMPQKQDAAQKRTKSAEKHRVRKDVSKQNGIHDQDEERYQASAPTSPLGSLGRWLMREGKQMKGKLRGGE